MKQKTELVLNLMEVMAGDNVETPIWDVYKEIIAKYDDRGADAVGNIERFKFTLKRLRKKKKNE